MILNNIPPEEMLEGSDILIIGGKNKEIQVIENNY